MTSELLITYF